MSKIQFVERNQHVSVIKKVKKEQKNFFYKFFFLILRFFAVEKCLKVEFSDTYRVFLKNIFEKRNVVYKKKIKEANFFFK